MRRLCLRLLLFSLVFGSVISCGRHKLRPDEIERNRIYSEILKRTDRRIIGGDGFFDRHLAGSSDPQAGQWCAVALGRIGNPQALPLLYAALSSPFAAVRAAAAFAIGEIEDRDLLKEAGIAPDPLAAAKLTALLDDNSLSVQMRAIEALGKAGEPARALAIAGRLASFRYNGYARQRSWLELAITALMRLGNPAAYPVLERLALSSDPDIQWRALNALVRMGHKGAPSIFLRQLESSNPYIQAYAARGVGMSGDPGLAGILLPLLGQSVSLPVRVCAVQALGRLRYAGAVPAIVSALPLDPVTGIGADQINFAVQASGALGRIGASEALAALERLIRIPGPLADSAVIALAQILTNAPERFFALADGSRFTTPAARRAWARALGELGGPVAVRELKKMLEQTLADGAESSEKTVIPAILTALADAGAHDLQELLVPVLGMRDGAILRASAAAYSPVAGESAPWRPIVQAYFALAATNELETKTALLRRLEPWAQEAEVQAALRRALQDRNRNVRLTASSLLRMAGAADVPLDPGASESTMTDAAYAMVAVMRKERTVAFLETTRGNIEIELFREDAPLTVANFISLARSGFYNGLSFMRVVPFFVIQGGDPRNDQEGGPGYSIRCEINMRPYERGSVGMALSGKDTGGSQFFITLSPQPHLDGVYTCFGRVISGMRVADRIIAGDRINSIRVRDEVSMLDYRRY